jgi:hypothetical protein
MLGKSLGRAILAQFHPKMWLLSWLPMFASVLLWGTILWLVLPGMMDQLQTWLLAQDAFRQIGAFWIGLGLLTLKTVLVPLLAMWLLLPLMVVFVLLLVATVLQPVIARFVGSRDYPLMEKKRGGDLFGGLLNALLVLLIFAVLWLLTLPTMLVPPLALLVHSLLWGYLTWRVMIYDALADYASVDERETLTRQYRWPLLVIGTITGLIGNLPTFLWLGGALSVVFLPVTAILSIWLYLVIFIFSGLWFQYFALEALQQLRLQRGEWTVVDPRAGETPGQGGEIAIK